MKKLLAMLLMLAMLASLFVGCAGDADTDNGDETKSTSGGDVTEGGNTDDTEDNGEPVKITIGMRESAMVEDYATNDYFKWLEEQTGYEIEIQLFPSNSGDANTQLSTRLLNEDSTLPDMLLGFRGLSATTWRMYGEDGYFVPLTDYFNDREGKAKVWYDRLEEIGVSDARLKQILLTTTAGDGNNYAFPSLEFGSVDNMDYHVMINQTWLNELNLEMPHDIDSFYETLKAFKAAHPDCYPLIGLKGDASDVVSYVINMFTYFDDTQYSEVSEDGKTLEIKYDTDEYREGLEFAHKLYSEGLLYIAGSRAELKAMVNVDDSEMCVGMLVDHPTLIFETGNTALYNYAAVPMWGYAVVNENARRNENFITEAAAEHGIVDECWNLLMVMCSEESSYRQRYGNFGTDWTWADEGTMSTVGLEAEIKVINSGAFTTLGNTCIGIVCATMLNNCENEATQIPDDASEWDIYKYNMMTEQHQYYYEQAEKVNPKYDSPVLTFTQDERDTYNDTISNVKSWIQQYKLGFIMGTDGIDPSNDADWNAYLKGLEDNGIAAWREVYQNVYAERYMADVIG